MWKNYILKFEQCHKTDLKQYILDVSKLFNTPLYSFKDLEELNTRLQTTNDLFPSSFFLINILNHKNSFKLFISLLYHFEDLKKINFILNENNPQEFLEQHTGVISMTLGSLLFKDFKERTLNFLFIYFLPSINRKKIFNLGFDGFLCQRKTWISNALITINHFNMLLFLIDKEKNHEEHENLINDIIESYIEYPPTFYKKNKQFIKKIKLLLNHNYRYDRRIPLSQVYETIINNIIIKLKNEKLHKVLNNKKNKRKIEKI